MFAFSERLLSGKELREQLSVALAAAEGQVSLGSAYLKTPALEWAATQLRASIPVRVLTRWKPRDLLSGASDIEAYEVANARGWPFFIQEDFHGKVYLVERCALFVGSANLTGRGFNLYSSGNDEINVRADLSSENYEFVDQIFKRAVLVDQTIYTEIRNWHDANKEPFQGDENLAWPKNLAKLLKPNSSAEKLLVAECFHTDGAWVRQIRDVQDQQARAIERDLSLLGFGFDAQGAVPDMQRVSEGVRQTKMYSWLCEKLRRSEGHELHFGALTAALHDGLLDDPAPFRSEVKGLLANLLSWIELAQISEISVDRPNYSQRVTLRHRQ